DLRGTELVELKITSFRSPAIASLAPVLLEPSVEAGISHGVEFQLEMSRASYTLAWPFTVVGIPQIAPTAESWQFHITAHRRPATAQEALELHAGTASGAELAPVADTFDPPKPSNSHTVFAREPGHQGITRTALVSSSSPDLISSTFASSGLFFSNPDLTAGL